MEEFIGRDKNCTYCYKLNIAHKVEPMYAIIGEVRYAIIYNCKFCNNVYYEFITKNL